MRIIRGKSVARVIKMLPEVFKAKIRYCYDGGTDDEDRKEFALASLWSDIVGEVAYRAQEGLDGNWTEFANQWKLPVEAYDTVLGAMRSIGFDETKDEF